MVVYFQVSYLMKKKKEKKQQNQKYIESKLDRQINFDLRVLQNKSWPKIFLTVRE